VQLLLHCRGRSELMMLSPELRAWIAAKVEERRPIWARGLGGEGVMASPVGTPNVGAIDPKLRTSPVVEETSEEADTARQASPGDNVCFFNGVAFEPGAFVRSGTMILECREGLWIEIGPADPRNP
jgi:hypothetical protein